MFYKKLKERSSEKVNKIENARRNWKRSNGGVKLFIIIKLHKQFIIVKHDKFRSLSHFMLGDYCIQYVDYFSSALHDKLELNKTCSSLFSEPNTLAYYTTQSYITLGPCRLRWQPRTFRPCWTTWQRHPETKNNNLI